MKQRKKLYWRPSVTDMITKTMRKHKEKMVNLIISNNALLKRLSEMK